MHLIDDVDFVAGTGGQVAHAFDDLTNVINTGTRRSIHFDYIGMTAFHDGVAVHALFAQFDAWVLGAFVALVICVIKRAGQNAGRGGFTHTAHAS